MNRPRDPRGFNTPHGFICVAESNATELRLGTAVDVGAEFWTGTPGELLGFTVAHGFAVVALAGAEHLLHPEVLRPFAGELRPDWRDRAAGRVR